MTCGANDLIEIRKAVLGDLGAIKGLADAHRTELGFVRRPALEESIRRKEVLIAETDTGVIGFVEYHHRRDPQTTLYHIAVTADQRRQGVGARLLEALRSEAENLGKEIIRLKCPDGLPSQGFYARVGFVQEGKTEGKARPLTLWALPLQQTLLFRAAGRPAPQ